MSLIMLLNKIQTVADLSEFFTVPAEDINRIVKDSPMTVIDIIAMVMRALCTKLNLTSEETEECVQKVRTRDMGYLWANMEKIDVQAEREKSRKIRAQLQEDREKLQEDQKKLREERAKMQAKMEELQASAQEEIARLKALLEEHGIV